MPTPRRTAGTGAVTARVDLLQRAHRSSALLAAECSAWTSVRRCPIARLTGRLSFPTIGHRLTGRGRAPTNGPPAVRFGPTWMSALDYRRTAEFDHIWIYLDQGGACGAAVRDRACKGKDTPPLMTRPWPGARYVRGVTKIADDEPVWWPRRIGREPVAARLRGRARISRQGRYYALTARQVQPDAATAAHRTADVSDHARAPRGRLIFPACLSTRVSRMPIDGQRVSARKEQVGSMHDERLGHPEVA